MTIVETDRYLTWKKKYHNRLSEGFWIALCGLLGAVLLSGLIQLLLTSKANEIALTNFNVYMVLPTVYQHINTATMELALVLSVVSIIAGIARVCLSKCPESIYPTKKTITVIDKAIVSLNECGYKHVGEGKIYIGETNVLRCDTDAYFVLNKGSKYDVWVNEHDSIGRYELLEEKTQ